MRNRRRLLVLISTGACLGICGVWHRSLATSDGVTWCRYRECGLPIKEFRATNVATRYGGIEIFECREQFTCSPTDVASVPVEWNDDVDQHRGIQFGSGPTMRSNTDPQITLKDQTAFASSEWSNFGARPWAVTPSIIGTHTERQRTAHIPLWPLVLLTAVLPLLFLWQRRRQLMSRRTTPRPPGFPVMIGRIGGKKGDIPR